MNVEVSKTFEKDVLKIKDRKLAAAIASVIDEIEVCKQLSELKNIKKMKATGAYYRLRIGDYRLGFKTENNKILLLRFMHRKEIYKYFP